MKLRSVISLIIAAALILSGIVVCVVASVMADSADVMLFPAEDDNGNLVYRMDISGTTKINIDSADADIVIIGGAEESSIEVVNFNANYYKLSQSNGSLAFGQVDDFLSMFKFWDNGFSFKGMRYILRYGDDAAGDKKVVINLKDDSDINLIQLSSVKGDISVKDCGFSADYTVRSDKGAIKLSGLTSALSMNVSGDAPDITIDKCSTEKLVIGAASPIASISSSTAKSANVIIENGDVSFNDCSVPDINANIADGDISLTPYSCTSGVFNSLSGKITLNMTSTDSLAAIVSTVTGKISVNGEYADGFSRNAPAAENNLTVSTEDGDVFITYPINE